MVFEVLSGHLIVFHHSEVNILFHNYTLIKFIFSSFVPQGADSISEGAFVGERRGGENAVQGADNSIQSRNGDERSCCGGMTGLGVISDLWRINQLCSC